MPSTSSENLESENSSLVKIQLLWSGRQRHQGSGKKQVEHWRILAEKEVCVGFKNERQPRLAEGRAASGTVQGLSEETACLYSDAIA